MTTKSKVEADSTSNIPEVNALRGKITDIDALSQSGFSQIESIAQLALIALQTPEGYRCIDDIYVALEAIRHKAQDIQNCINSEAENVGCNYIDDAQRRSWDAQRAYMEKA